TDLSGIRIITYLPSEVDLLIRHLRESMDVDEANSRVVSDEMETDRFGYQSTHLVLSYSAERLALPDFARFADMKAEIQVRTVLQHAWAA
ncbi:RelA/SpoT domain-containing protein, partial [Escherichia coli]|nr:RelA/SpoT domain-containing protein [Escherichia coli]